MQKNIIARYTEACLSACFILFCTMCSESAAADAADRGEYVGVHGQVTNTQQYHGVFPAAYSGAQSLASSPDTAKTFDATLFLGARVWKRGELYVNPELDQGFGLGNFGPPGGPYTGTVGAAGYVSGEAYKVGRGMPYMRVQRIFLRQTFERGGEKQKIDGDINQLAGTFAAKRLTLTAGKFAVTDIFDTNPYAHDPKADFLNWSIIDMAAFDYAADAWGYTYGIAAENVTQRATLRAGLFTLPSTPNDVAVERTPFRQYSPMLEYERRTSFFGGHPGAIKALAYEIDGYFASYADAIDAGIPTATTPSTALERSRRHKKFGEGLNIEQEVAPHVGVFARASAMDGRYEPDAFTDADRALSAGVSVADVFKRPNDVVAIAVADNALAAPARRYLAAGGLGILIGDGALTYGDERVVEGYYKLGITKDAAVTVDLQHIANPGYNTARGPLNVWGLRYHIEK